MNILDQIIESKKISLNQKKEAVSIKKMEASVFFNRNCESLVKRLGKTDTSGIIAEFKRKSPSRGIINDKADVVKITNAYSTFGASGLSVLTDENFFGGSKEDLLKARVNNTPICANCFCFVELICINHEIFTQNRSVVYSCFYQIFFGAAKEIFICQY